ncbi:serine/threonine protein kinase [Cohnella kolymensis]|uniref:Serine/threonine protein kinase n=1 Tax=Cohnella kolymensis TaxID=1590652 RepID=A0ABR5A1M4_9BACL|nr:serine/threonine protein kinase [Cohnella kolymensis]
MTTLSDKKPLPPGTKLVGKWNGKSYHLERLLGLGANGQVYLALAGGRSVCAVKIGLEAAELQGEANILASLNILEKQRRPFLLDVDDAVLDGKDVPFYVMRYIPGSPVKDHLRANGSHWFGVIGYRLLERLAALHEAGWVFGDIKSDNVLVTDYGQVELVDYGGMTAKGRSIRQFTEIYDRGYWSAGTRIADPAYDWFAVAILWLHCFDGKRLTQLSRTLIPQNRHPRELMKLVRSNPRLKPMEAWMDKAFAGRFLDSRDACANWRETIRETHSAKAKASQVPAWMAGLFAASIVLCATAAVWLFH